MGTPTPAILHALGIIYFSAWSISFYPQVILNYTRKTASGLSQDFSILNPLGFLCYSIYTLALTFSPLLRAQYAARNEGHVPQVSAADIGFSLHAFLLSSVSLAQTYWYSRAWGRGEPAALRYQRIADGMLGVDTIGTDLEPWIGKPGVRERTTRWTWVSLLGIGVALAGGLVGVCLAKMELLDFVYLISYVKLYISIAKWLPQLLLNYARKSTHGFSTHVILLDLLGSLTSLAELVLASLAAHDPRGIVGNPVKLGLGVLTIGFDAVFVVQRYVLYGEGEALPSPSPSPSPVQQGRQGTQQPDEETPLLRS